MKYVPATMMALVIGAVIIVGVKFAPGPNPADWLYGLWGLIIVNLSIPRERDCICCPDDPDEDEDEEESEE